MDNPADYASQCENLWPVWARRLDRTSAVISGEKTGAGHIVITARSCIVLSAAWTWAMSVKAHLEIQHRSTVKFIRYFAAAASLRLFLADGPSP